MRRHRSAVLALPVALAAALAIGGCGLAVGPGTSRVRLTVTEDFGGRVVGQAIQRHPAGSETVLQLLERNFHVVTGSGGRAVTSIDGRPGSSSRVGWSYYVNGIAAAQGAAATPVHPGDQVWWDLHDRGATASIPAVVGSFPEPFTSGTAGKRLPTVLDCAADVGAACSAVGHALRSAHVPFADQTVGGGAGSDSLAIVVGTWRDLHGIIAADLIAAGPQKSGIYARFVGAAGEALELEDAAGRVVRTLRSGAGLVAATEQPSLNQPTWLITGTDAAGVAAAAGALTPARLHDHFALAVSGGRDLPLPLGPSR